jgi:hypothetical protein
MQHDLIYFFEWRANIKKALISKKKKKKAFVPPCVQGLKEIIWKSSLQQPGPPA